MNPAMAEALRALHRAVDLLEETVGDTEPAPMSVVLVRTKAGKVHRAARIDGIPGLMTYEADNLDGATYLHDLSAISDEFDLCGRCFGPLDEAVEE